MLKRVTSFLALLCVPAVVGLAQQPFQYNTNPEAYRAFKEMAASKISLPAMITPGQHVLPVLEPPAVLLNPVDTAINMMKDTSEFAFLVRDSENPNNILAFSGLITFPAGGAALGFTLPGPAQLIPPMPGIFAIDSVTMLLFREPGSPQLEGDIYMIPVYTPSSINWNQFQGVRRAASDFAQIPGQGEIMISAETINSRFPNDDAEVLELNIETPGLEIPANQGFGFLFYPTVETDTFRLWGGYEWNTSVRPTGGFIMHSTVTGEDSVATFFGNLQWNQNSPAPLTNQPIRQNFVFVMSGRFEAVTSVRPDENGNNNGLALEANYPNPASNETHIRFSVDKMAPVTLRLTNMLGQVVETSSNSYGPGSYVWDLNTSHLPTGTYIYSLSVGDRTITRTMTIAR